MTTRAEAGAGPGECGGGPESLPKPLQRRAEARGSWAQTLAAPARARARRAPGRGAHLLAPSILSAPRLHVICRVSSLTWKVFRSGRCDFLE